MLKTVKKRDGNEVAFDADRIERAVSAAMQAVGSLESERVRVVKLSVMASFMNRECVTVEEIQDEVERTLMALGEYDAAKAYILYRDKKAALRPTEYGDSGISDYIVMSKYSRYLPDKGRRELWPEATKRVFDMHRDYFSTLLKKRIPVSADANGQPTDVTLADLIDRVEAVVTRKDVLPSMRTMQFGGDAILQNNMRAFNCIAGYIDTPRRFSEVMWLLLCGCGVGFSVQKHHVAKLPAFPVRGNEEDLTVVHVQISDSIEGWADALNALIQSHYDGTYVEFDYSQIRKKGAPLKLSGGKAPGHLPLKKALGKTRDLLRKVSGRHMRPIEAYDIIMFAASAVISGGIRRSATIALFSADDEEMVHAKTGEWWKTNPQRQHSNNSAMLKRDEATREDFDALFNAIREFGEPGFYFTDSYEYATNPCVEIGLNPTLVVDNSIALRLASLRYTDALNPGQVLTGWQSCNLSTINGARCTTPEIFYQLCVEAAVIGTLQAAYTGISVLLVKLFWNVSHCSA
jgi:ribonucleoside-diphosphate reductase alpha chain